MNATHMLPEVVTDERAWSADTVDAQASWFTSLSEDCLLELERWLAEHAASSEEATTLRVLDAQLSRCRELLSPVTTELDAGRGFALIDGVPMERFSPSEATAIYWLLGQILGEPFKQDIRGTLLYDVRDTGQDVKQGARFSVTNAESSFHTDGAFNPQVPDYVGLLCLAVAKSGGESELVSAVSLHNELLERDAEALRTLYGPFCFDRRGQFAAGEESVTETPIFRWDGQELFHRYLHYYIRVGHELIGRPLSTELERALEAVEALLKR
ncbi:MAG: TauD/TfdA family dioxygenase [Trueperaceae bacterium]|nr:MAG: TauD/TfdA family dioxygenase [Trueperaceae bacterium]